MSIWIAKLAGPLMLITGIPIVFRTDLFQELLRRFLEPHLIWLAGLLTTLGGLAIVNTHNVWAGDWTLIITILGWAMVIGGPFRVLFPKFVVKFGEKLLDKTTLMRVVGAVWVVLGAVLVWKGYF